MDANIIRYDRNLALEKAIGIMPRTILYPEKISLLTEVKSFPRLLVLIIIKQPIQYTLDLPRELMTLRRMNRLLLSPSVHVKGTTIPSAPTWSSLENGVSS